MGKQIFKSMYTRTWKIESSKLTTQVEMLILKVSFAININRK